uniref:Transposase Tc1-like domain-containing protein n=1 Tax=Vespula pensylvanica TaxID=30213 RepID=A0A834JVU7_VESPE|nr:hypothetical protein H0235_017475 [Vespula pensylvanica]
MKSANIPVKCALREGDHPANYRGCLVHKKLQQNKFPRQRPKILPNQPTVQHHSSTSLNKVKFNCFTTYAEAVKGFAKEHATNADNSAIDNKLMSIKNIRIALWNSNRLMRRKLEIEAFIASQQIQVVLISETHFTNKNYIKIKGYKVYTTQHPSGRVHGEYLKSPYQLSPLIKPFCYDEVKLEITKLNPKKVPGYNLITAREIAREADVRSVRHVLQTCGHLKQFKMKREPPLTKEHKKQRLQFARDCMK